jgi:hypothetical protein
MTGNGDEKNAINMLRQLQKERLIVSRLGFPDKAFELDKEIERMREKARKARNREESKILEQRMKLLRVSHMRKQQRLEYILEQETNEMMERFRQEEENCLKRQEQEFLRVLENATRRAVGRVKKCNCTAPYLCRHNKTASYNTRRPSKIVVQYRRNGKRLRQGGRPEEVYNTTTALVHYHAPVCHSIILVFMYAIRISHTTHITLNPVRTHVASRLVRTDLLTSDTVFLRERRGRRRRRRSMSWSRRSGERGFPTLSSLLHGGPTKPSLIRYGVRYCR